MGGIYARYCLSILFDHNHNEENDIQIQSSTLSINGKPIQLMNYISLASPHCGSDDKCNQMYCCCADSCYSAAVCMKKYCCYPPTLQQLLLLDDQQLLHQMATNEIYLKPLRAFKRTICYGNGNNDIRVSCKSALMLYGSDEDGLGQRYWNMMIDKGDTTLVRELIVDNKDEQQEAEKQSDDCWYSKLRDNIQWRKVVVCFITKWIS